MVWCFFLLFNCFFYIWEILRHYQRQKKKGYNNSLFLKVSGLSVFFLEKRVIYKLITVLIYLAFFATLALSYFDGIEFSFLKDLLIKTDFAIIPVLIIVNYIYSRKWFCINICESWIMNNKYLLKAMNNEYVIFLHNWFFHTNSFTTFVFCIYFRRRQNKSKQ